MLSPRAADARPTIATTAGRWVATSIRAILLNPAYVGDAIWNVRSMPKFHGPRDGKIVEVEEFQTNGVRKNSHCDWVIKRDAHAPLIERRVFEAVAQRLRARPAMPRGHRHEYLLTDCMACSCGDVMTGMTRIRRKLVAGKERIYEDPIYVCAGGLRAKGICRQIGIPCDIMDLAVMRILDEEVFSPEGFVRLERAIRQERARRESAPSADGVETLVRRERELAGRVADGARRILQVDEALVSDVRAALEAMKADLDRVRRSLDEARKSAAVTEDVDDVVTRTIRSIRSMATLLRDPVTPLDRRREILRRLLPAGPNGERPIRVYFDLGAGRGWERALQRVTVRHISTRLCHASVVAGAVAAEAGHSDTPRGTPFDGLPTSARELTALDFEVEPQVVGASDDAPP